MEAALDALRQRRHSSRSTFPPLAQMDPFVWRDSCGENWQCGMEGRVGLAWLKFALSGPLGPASKESIHRRTTAATVNTMTQRYAGGREKTP